MGALCPLNISAEQTALVRPCDFVLLGWPWLGALVPGHDGTDGRRVAPCSFFPANGARPTAVAAAEGNTEPRNKVTGGASTH